MSTTEPQINKCVELAELLRREMRMPQATQIGFFFLTPDPPPQETPCTPRRELLHAKGKTLSAAKNVLALIATDTAPVCTRMRITNTCEHWSHRVFMKYRTTCAAALSRVRTEHDSSRALEAAEEALALIAGDTSPLCRNMRIAGKCNDHDHKQHVKYRKASAGALRKIRATLAPEREAAERAADEVLREIGEDHVIRG